MGTRGILGIRIDGIDKLAYNHFDSYPESLGEKTVSDIQRLLVSPGIEALREQARALRVVDKNSKPSAADVELLAPYTDLGVSRQSTQDWYCLTRELQGDLAKTLQTGVLIDSADFIADSLFCEYAYVVNFDENVFECYRGFQTEKHSQGRYADLPCTDKGNCSCQYYPVALVGAFPLSDIPEDWAKQAYSEED